jgi:hypothetical protein
MIIRTQYLAIIRAIIGPITVDVIIIPYSPGALFADSTLVILIAKRLFFYGFREMSSYLCFPLLYFLRIQATVPNNNNIIKAIFNPEYSFAVAVPEVG